MTITLHFERKWQEVGCIVSWHSCRAGTECTIFRSAFRQHVAVLVSASLTPTRWAFDWHFFFSTLGKQSHRAAPKQENNCTSGGGVLHRLLDGINWLLLRQLRRHIWSNPTSSQWPKKKKRRTSAVLLIITHCYQIKHVYHAITFTKRIWKSA